MTNGVLYIASGDDYVNEAISSAQSLRRQMPDISIALATTDRVDSDVFDTVIDHESPYAGVGQSIITPDLMPYDRTLYLDTDTYVADPIYELFEILDEHEMCFARGNGDIALPKPYDAWKEFNTGVIGYKASDSVAALFERWAKNYEELRDTRKYYRSWNDQPAFGVSILESDIRYFVLPRRYNCRLPRGGKVGDDIKIGHGRLDEFDINLQQAVERINQRTGPRMYTHKVTWNLNKTIAVYEQSDSLHRKLPRMFFSAVKHEGLLPAVRAAKNRALTEIK